MSDDYNFNYEDLWFIKTVGKGSKQPLDAWGGYSQDYEEADDVYSHADVEDSSHDAWAVNGIQNIDHGEIALLIFDLDVHKAGPDFDIEDLTVPANTAIVKSQNGGFHVYFAVHSQRGSGKESDFEMTQDLTWDIDIRGSYVSHHVVAPGDIPGVTGDYELVQDESIAGVFNPGDAAETIRYKDEPLLEYQPDTAAADFEFEHSGDPPESMPACYHAGLELRLEDPEDATYNPHKVNTLTALCGIAAGYDLDEMVEHFTAEYPPGGNPVESDRGETEYQIETMARKMERGSLAPPSISSLREYGILGEDETCDCDIAYHGGDDDDGMSPAAMWEWWADARARGDIKETSVIPEQALRHVAAEHTTYDFESLGEDADEVDELPPKAHNRALSWVKHRWPEQRDLDLGEDEEVTARNYRKRDTAVYTWEDVRYIYEGGDGQPDKQGGRFAAVQLLRSKYDFATPEDTERLHLYEPDVGVYEPTAELIVDRELDANLGRFYSQHEKNEILGRLKAGTYRPRDEFEAGQIDGQYLCVENGVIDLDTRERLEHDPKYLFTSFLPVEYDPAAEPTEISTFLDDITRREEDKQTMLEMLGNTFLPSYDYESFLVLFGEGSNGKSTWYSVVRQMLGRDNVSSMTLQTLSDNQFAASNLLGKLANIGEDLPEKKIQDVGTLKDLTGGGETFVEEKGKQGFDMENRAKLMFAANRPPVLGEKSEAVKRRLLPIRLPYQFVPEPDSNDPNQKQAVKEGLVDDLTTDEELSGLLNLALDGLDRLRETGDFSLPESNDERLEYYEQFSDPIKEFAINCMENSDGVRVKKDTVYNAYTNFCRQNDYESSVDSVFWRQLRRTALNVSVVRPSADDSGRRVQYLDNTSFTEFGLKYVDEDSPNVIVDDGAAAESSAPKPTPIEAITPGYETITVDVLKVDTDTPPNGPSLSGTVEDETAPVDIVEWGDTSDFAASLEEGESYRIEKANIGYNSDGAIQAELVPNVSTLTSIQSGTGYTPGDDPDSGSDPEDAGSQSSLEDSTSDDEAVADGGKLDQKELDDKIEQWTTAKTDGSQGADRAAVAAAVAEELDEEKSRIEDRIDTLVENNRRVYEPAPDHLMVK